MLDFLKPFDNIIRFHFTDYQLLYMIIGSLVIAFGIFATCCYDIKKRGRNEEYKDLWEITPGVVFTDALYCAAIWIITKSGIVRYSIYIVLALLALQLVLSLIAACGIYIINKYRKTNIDKENFFSNSLSGGCLLLVSIPIAYLILMGAFKLSTYCVEPLCRRELIKQFSQGNYPVDIDFVHAKINIAVSTDRLYNDHVGHEWVKRYYVNGKRVDDGSVITVNTSRPLEVKTTIEEMDRVPDISSSSRTIHPSIGELLKGRSLKLKTTVFENRGRYSGHAAGFETEFKIKIEIPASVVWKYVLPFWDIEYKLKEKSTNLTPTSKKTPLHSHNDSAHYDSRYRQGLDIQKIYISTLKVGACHASKICEAINGSKEVRTTSVEEAVALGYSICNKCFPEDYCELYDIMECN